MKKLPSQNSTSFQEEINKLFEHFTIKPDEAYIQNFCEQSLKKIELRTFQKFIGEYLSYEGHRGLLVYWGLGSGKTLGAVSVCNTIKDKDIVIILPASLKDNFKYFMDTYYTGDSKINYVSYNASNLVDQVDRIIDGFNDKIVIVDEAHGFFQNVISGQAKQAITVHDKMVKAKNAKFVFMTGTPITGDPFELSPMFNVLRAPKTALPKDIDEFYEYFVSDEFNSIKNKEIFQDRITGLVSYYRGIKDEHRDVVPEHRSTEIIKVPMGQAQWASYITVRSKELDDERKSKYAKKAFKKEIYKKESRASIGTFKILSAQVCDFAFPADVEKKFKEMQSNMQKIPEIAETKWQLMTESYSFAQIYEMLPQLSNKHKKIIDEIVQDIGYKKFCFTPFKIVGSRILGKMLEQTGFHRITEKDLDKELPNRRSFIIIDGDTKEKDKMIRLFNKKDNIRGEKIELLIGTRVVEAGVSLSNVRKIYVLKPQWRANILRQAIGRAIRTCSHTDLPKEERTVDVKIYLSTVPNPSLKVKLDIDGGRTTDEYLYDISSKRETLIKTFEEAMQEISVDCKFNLADNELKGQKVNCRICENPGKILYPDDIKEHILRGSSCVAKITERVLKDYIHQGKKYKKDMYDNLYEWDSKSEMYKEIGFIKEGKVYIESGEDFTFLL